MVPEATYFGSFGSVEGKCLYLLLKYARGLTVQSIGFQGSVSLTKWSYSMSRTVSWIVFSSAALLFMPIMIETERLQIQDQEKAKKNHLLLGAGIVTH